MADASKAELQETIRELRAKLKEMKELEKQVKLTAKELSQSAIGVHKDSDGKYSLVHVKYDVEKNAAIIDRVEKLDTPDFAIASYKARQELGERILRKARGDKYVE